MAVIDASVYVALINAHDKDHARSWAWFEQAKAEQESIVLYMSCRSSSWRIR